MLAVLRKYVLIIVALLLFVCAQTVAIIALVGERNDARTSAHAAERAESVAQCINHILSTRNTPAVNDNLALVSLAQADAVEWQAMRDLVVAKGRPAQLAAYKVFVRVVRDTSGTYAQVVRTLHADQAARAAHPLGRC